MYRIRARQLVEDIRSGMSDDELMKKYDLSSTRLQRVMWALVEAKAIDHDELCAMSPAYRRLAAVLDARKFPRVPVPIAIWVHCTKAKQKGILRDISESGLRVAGIEAKAGDAMTLHVPLTEITSLQPLDLHVVCRRSQIQGKRKRYVVGGFEIIRMSDASRVRLRELLEFLVPENFVDNPRPLPFGNWGRVVVDQGNGDSAVTTEVRDFTGTIDGVDILDFVQFMLLTGKRKRLAVESADGDTCELFLEGGKIVHALHGGHEGKDAFFECMSLPGGRVSTSTWNGDSAANTIDDPAEFLLIEAARRRDDACQVNCFGEELVENEESPSHICGHVDGVKLPAKLEYSPQASFAVHDSDDSMNSGTVLSLNQIGLRVAGIRIRIGQRKTLLLEAKDLPNVLPVTLETECRWTQLEPDGTLTAGLEIIDIAHGRREEFGNLLKLYRLSE